MENLSYIPAHVNIEIFYFSVAERGYPAEVHPGIYKNVSRDVFLAAIIKVLIFFQYVATIIFVRTEKE